MADLRSEILAYVVAPLLLLLCTPIEKCFSHSKKNCSGAQSFYQLDILLTCHFIHLPFHQLAIPQLAIFLNHSIYTRDYEILGANLD
jgi:hypothetical protein